jgi:hypothetical protein
MMCFGNLDAPDDNQLNDNTPAGQAAGVIPLWGCPEQMEG